MDAALRVAALTAIGRWRSACRGIRLLESPADLGPGVAPFNQAAPVRTETLAQLWALLQSPNLPHEVGGGLRPQVVLVLDQLEALHSQAGRDQWLLHREGIQHLEAGASAITDGAHVDGGLRQVWADVLDESRRRHPPLSRRCPHLR